MRFCVVIVTLDGPNLAPYVSIMIDSDLPGPSRDNIRSLLYLLGSELDRQIAEVRHGTPYEHVRPSDIRVFVYASAGTSSISDIARQLGISRQAVHMSAQRLKDLGVVALAPVQPGKRDVMITLTPQGLDARRTAEAQIVAIEKNIADVLGVDGLETLRRTLQVLIETSARKAVTTMTVMPPG